jgi:hypothetical protein
VAWFGKNWFGKNWFGKNWFGKSWQHWWAAFRPAIYALQKIIYALQKIENERERDHAGHDSGQARHFSQAP